MTDKQPITIQRGAFVCTIFDVENLMALPLANVRKLWKIMFSETCENKDTIQTINDWLPQTVTCSEAAIQEEQTNLWQVTQYTNALRSKVAAFGSMATKEQKAELKKATSVLGMPKNEQKMQKQDTNEQRNCRPFLTIFQIIKEVFPCIRILQPKY